MGDKFGHVLENKKYPEIEKVIHHLLNLYTCHFFSGSRIRIKNRPQTKPTCGYGFHHRYIKQELLTKSLLTNSL